MSDDRQERPEGVVDRLDRLERQVELVMEALLDPNGPPKPQADDSTRPAEEDPAERGMGQGPLTQQEVVGAFAKVLPVFDRLNEESPLVKLYRAASEEDSPHPEDTETAPATPTSRWKRMGVANKYGCAVSLSFDDPCPTPESYDRAFPHEGPHLPLVREADAEATVRELEERLDAAVGEIERLQSENRRLRDEFERMGRFDGFTQTDQRVLDPKGEGLGVGNPTQHELSERREP